MSALTKIAAAIRGVASGGTGSGPGGIITPGEMFAAVPWIGDGTKFRKVTSNVAGGGVYIGFAEVPQSNVVIPVAHPAPGYIGAIKITLAGGGGGAGAFWSPDNKSGTPGSGQTAQWTYNALGDEVSFTAQHLNWGSSTSMLVLTVVGGANNGKTLCVGGGESNNGGYGASSAATDRTALSTLTATKTFSGACRPYNSTISYSDSTSYDPIAPASYGNAITANNVNNIVFNLLGSTSPGGINIAGLAYGQAHKVGPSGAAGTPQPGAVVITVDPSTAIVNPISLAWTKRRDSSGVHFLFDSVRGPTSHLELSTALAATPTSELCGFTPDGFYAGVNMNVSAANYVTYMFKKQPNFFDILTWTGTGTTLKSIPHILGIKPGLIIVKTITGAAISWYVYHKSLGIGYLGQLDLPNAFGNSPQIWGNTEPDASNIYVGDNANLSGSTYVAYVFADDSSASSMVKVGTLTVSASRNDVVDLGWEAAWVMTKTRDTSDAWRIHDNARDWSLASQTTMTQSTSAEVATSGWITPHAKGFALGGSGYAAGTVIVYLAIRRSLIAPVTGKQVYNAINRLWTSATPFKVTGVGFSPDLGISILRQGGQSAAPNFKDRMRGYNKSLVSSSQAAETNWTDEVLSFDPDGVTVGTGATSASWNYSSTYTYIQYFFKRAIGVFDVVCYTGTGVAHAESHNLGAVPELIITKARSSASQNWATYVGLLGATKFLALDLNSAQTTDASNIRWNNTAPTDTTFTVGTGANVNGSGTPMVAYLFASKAGISKVGSYVGNGSSQTINCGFSNGARFVLIKRTDLPGDWVVWDSVRGIVAAFDPHSALNLTGAEISDDGIDPDPSGFVINQDAGTNANVTGSTYIFLAIA